MGLAGGLAVNGDIGHGGGATGVTVQGTAGGNLGATQTVNFAGAVKEIHLVGTANANLTVTFSNRAAGAKCFIFFTQDGTGSRTLTISDGTNTAAVGVDATAGNESVVYVECPDSTNINVTPMGGGGAVASVFTRTGAIVAASGDYTAAQVTNAADKSTASQQNFTGEIKAPDYLVAGLTGATAATRFVGGTASGAPVSGTFVLGDWAFDQAGSIWLCTTGGSPGTWKSAGGGSGSVDGGSPTSTFVLSIDGGTP